MPTATASTTTVTPDLRADFILANPPFNVSDWGGERLQDDQRWRYGDPPRGNANFAWVQHFLYHLAPRGQAGFVLANGSMSSGQSGEGQIRKNIVEAGLVDCIIALPGQLFRSTQIPACLWFLSGDRGVAERRDETLFIDARNLGHMIDRTRRDLSADDIARIATTYHNWRNGNDAPLSPSPGGEGWGEGSSGQPPLGLRKGLSQGECRGEGRDAATATSPAESPAADDVYADVPGFCKSASIDEIRKHGHVLTPGRYVGAAPQEDDGEPFEEKMVRLTRQWRRQQVEARRLDAAIEDNLALLGFLASAEETDA